MPYIVKLHPPKSIQLLLILVKIFKTRKIL